MDGPASCVFFKLFVCWWNLATRPSSTAILLSLPKSVCIATYDWLRALVHLHCDAPQRMICWELSCTCIVTSRSGRKQSKHGDVADLSRVTSHVCGRKFGTKTRCKRDESMSIGRGRSKNSRQVWFFLVNALYFFINLQPPKLSFNQKIRFVSVWDAF